ncbi:MAG: serine/threonine protein kinase [Acidobacteria bacterium]|nr:serine/threonine protein kinase [Acidobacteriota bacterium]
MSNKIGRFEILSEIAHSENGAVYKASDSEGGQTIALKTLKLEAFGEQAAALVDTLKEEAQAAKALNSPNIAQIFGVEEADGLFCASLEYVQGNSVATMLARKEGFSIWDLQDIARQTCQGLDHAHSKHSVHHSLEPSKIMVTWDGTVKVLGFGISSMSVFAAHASGLPPAVLHYMSPEQLNGDPLDARSNIFSLGAILYEMVTERKAFDGDDAGQVRQSILEMTPVAPDQVNRKLHPVLSQVIMRAIAKSPEDRYASGQDLVSDLERCKESSSKAAKTTAQPAQGLNAPKPAPAPRPAAVVPPAPVAQKPVPAPAPHPVAAVPPAPVAQKVAPAPAPTVKKVAAAAAGISAAPSWTSSSAPADPFIQATVNASLAAAQPAPTLSAAPPQIEPEQPKIAVDPMMAEPDPAGPASRSFSEIDELPPLQEAYVAPAPPTPTIPAAAELQPQVTFKSAPPEKPKVQPRVVAKKAVTEIKKTPPKLFLYSIGAAVGIILLIVAGIAYHIHSQNAEDEGTAVRSAATQAASASATPPQESAQAGVPAEPIVAESQDVSVKPKYAARKKGKTPVAEAPVVVPGQLTINTTPDGATVALDGHSDPSWLSPYNLTGLSPGQHTVVVSKAGYATETRTIDVAAGSKSFLVVQLAQLVPTLSVSGEPAGAEIWLDGKNTGKTIPAQFPVEKPGAHSVTVKKMGYLEETSSVNLQAGQVFHYSPALRALGSTEEIKTVGKFKKMFGGGGDTAGMGSVSVKTQPKGAQISVNHRILDKMSPVEFYLNPGTYVVDITLSGFKSVHRVVNVEKSGKVAIEETLERE